MSNGLADGTPRGRDDERHLRHLKSRHRHRSSRPLTSHRSEQEASEVNMWVNEHLARGGVDLQKVEEVLARRRKRRVRATA